MNFRSANDNVPVVCSYWATGQYRGSRSLNLGVWAGIVSIAIQWGRVAMDPAKYVNYVISTAGMRETPPHDKQMVQRLKKQWINLQEYFTFYLSFQTIL